MSTLRFSNYAVFLIMPFFSNAEFIIEKTSFDESEGYLDYKAYFTEKGLETRCQLSFNGTPEPADESLTLELVLGFNQDLVNLTFIRTGFNTEEYTGGYSVWRGSSEYGTITISTEDDVSAFYISYNGHDYTGVEAIDSKGYFFEVPANNYEACGVVGGITETPSSSLCDGDVCAASIKVLLLHDYVVDINTLQSDINGNIIYPNFWSARLAKARRMQVLSVLAVNQDVFDNSGVSLNLLYEFKYTSVPDETVGSATWLPQFANMRGAYTTLRDQANADVVQVIIDNRDWGLAGSADGDLDLIDLDVRYMTFAHLWASSNTRYTSAHEIAHIFGAAHRANTGAVICAGGIKFRADQSEESKTVMFNAISDYERIPYLSDPDETFEGFAIGAVALRNADVIRDALCRVDNTSTQVAWSFEIITGSPTCIDLDGTNGNSVFEVEVTPPLPVGSGPGRGPYVYRWEEITNGQVSFITSTMSTFIDLRSYLTPLPSQFQKRTIQVTAIASDGATLSESLSFYDGDCGFLQEDEMQLRIKPDYHYFNMLGQEVFITNENTDELPTGIYVKCSSVGGCFQFLVY